MIKMLCSLFMKIYSLSLSLGLRVLSVFPTHWSGSGRIRTRDQWSEDAAGKRKSIRELTKVNKHEAVRIMNVCSVSVSSSSQIPVTTFKVPTPSHGPAVWVTVRVSHSQFHTQRPQECVQTADLTRAGQESRVQVISGGIWFELIVKFWERKKERMTQILRQRLKSFFPHAGD